MRIILTQMEIEEAIEKLILDQVDVPDDMRIDIDLKATRGEEGYQAFIDIVDHDAPEDGSDRSVDPRIKPVDGAETLAIAEKVLEAKAEASKPRRRGRPAGARNKPKLSEDHRSTDDKVQVTDQVAEEPVQEAQESVSEAEVGQDTQEAEQTPVEAPAAPEQASEQASEQEAETEVAEQAPEQPVVAEAQAEEEPEVEVAPPVAAPTVTEQDVSAQASDELAESMSEPAQAPEAPEATERQPEPEPAPEPVSEPAPVNPQPTRSLFANLSRPTNGG